MEIICAGYPKTASKSCSSALRTLGYRVADYFETAEDLSREWWDFIDNKTTFKPVQGEYLCYANECIFLLKIYFRKFSLEKYISCGY